MALYGLHEVVCVTLSFKFDYIFCLSNVKFHVLYFKVIALSLEPYRDDKAVVFQSHFRVIKFDSFN